MKRIFPITLAVLAAVLVLMAPLTAYAYFVFSTPQSQAQDGPAPVPSAIIPEDYWAMTPGAVDDAALWAVMMQPITVYDGGLDQRAHVYLYENPDGSGKKVAQIHAQSQGLHILEEANVHGYALVEAYSNYDPDFLPGAEAEKADVFSRKQGYVKAANLKSIPVQQDIALLIDKHTQQLHIYQNGIRVASLSVSTGLDTGDFTRETIAGEFITVSHVGPFPVRKYVKSDMAIRINGGTLIHEVPYEELGDGSRRYRDYETVLGSKASAGCVRVQRQEDENGYSHAWLWKNLKSGAPYKVLIWDDLGRESPPEASAP